MEKCGHIDKRACKKATVNLDVRYLCGNTLCRGTVTELSENCVCINTNMCLPLNARVELIIPSKEKVLNITGQVRRVLLQMTDRESDSMSVEVINPSRQFLQLVDSFSNTI
jgi:hypothetical protein